MFTCNLNELVSIKFYSNFTQKKIWNLDSDFNLPLIHKTSGLPCTFVYLIVIFSKDGWWKNVLIVFSTLTGVFFTLFEQLIFLCKRWCINFLIKFWIVNSLSLKKNFKFNISQVNVENFNFKQWCWIISKWRGWQLYPHSN